MGRRISIFDRGQARAYWPYPGEGKHRVMRLACVYALMDGKVVVDIAHLTAALAFGTTASNPP